MTTAIDITALTKRYGKDLAAVDDISLQLEEGRIHGLLGRNGAGKTTLMQLITGQVFATSGDIRVFGEAPLENPSVLARTCFMQESQRYPDSYDARDVFRVARSVYSEWDANFAAQLIDDFRLPAQRRIKKLSRGQLSAVGIIVGMASRAPLTFFDEPYLGLDAVARQIFYDRLLTDYVDHPRTIVLSTHHIDEAAKLLEHVVVMDNGRIIIDDEADALRGTAITVSGRADALRSFIDKRETFEWKTLGSLATVTMLASEGLADAANAAGFDITPVSLQELIVQRTTRPAHDSTPEGARS